MGVPLVPVSDMPTVTLPVTVAPSAGLVEPLHNAGDGQVGLRRRRRTAQISPARRADGAPVLPRELTAQERRGHLAGEPLALEGRVALARGRVRRAHRERAVGIEQRQVGVEARCEVRSEEHTSELQSPYDLVCRLLLEKKNQ